MGESRTRGAVFEEIDVRCYRELMNAAAEVVRRLNRLVGVLNADSRSGSQSMGANKRDIPTCKMPITRDKLAIFKWRAPKRPRKTTASSDIPQILDYKFLLLRMGFTTRVENRCPLTRFAQ
ncbi:hypothetical protein MTP99_014880 [Tenebrio molitor]|jgi:hypothetical protein|nr:hypothetical protein MTP99_014880 [Tenebrio molitor]